MTFRQHESVQENKKPQPPQRMKKQPKKVMKELAELLNYRKQKGQPCGRSQEDQGKPPAIEPSGKLYQAKHGLDAYSAQRPGEPVRSSTLRYWNVQVVSRTNGRAPHEPKNPHQQAHR